MAAGEFRQDLYYRLNVFPIHIPPLRERKSDILALANAFAEKYGKMHRKNIVRISTPAIDMLMSYHWPGNVRELENCVERAVLLSTDDVIHGHHLPPHPPDRRGQRHGTQRHPRGIAGEPGTRTADRGAQVLARQQSQGRPLPRDHRAHHRPARREIRHRSAQVPYRHVGPEPLNLRARRSPSSTLMGQGR